MNMFGYEKIKEFARNNINRVVNTEFTSKQEDIEQDESLEEVLIEENKKLKSIIASLMEEKKQHEGEMEKKAQALRRSKDEIEDLKLKSMNLIISNQLLNADKEGKGSNFSKDFSDQKIKNMQENLENGDGLNDLDEYNTIEELVSRLKVKMVEIQNENNKIKQELANTQNNMEAERKSFQYNLVSDISTPMNEEDFEKKQQELEFLIQLHGVRIDSHEEYLKEIISKSNSDREKEIAYYLMKTKILDQISKASFKQQTTLNQYFKSEKQTLISNYEKTIDRLKKRIEDNKIAERQVIENAAATKELHQIKSELNTWRSKALKYKSSLSEMYKLKQKLKELKFQSRETGRILFDLNEYAREDCIKGLADVKQKLLIFTETIELLDHQTLEARKVVFDKNNQIGKYFNQVQDYKRQVENLENKNDQLELEIKLLKDKINNLNQSQRMNNYSNENLNTIEQVFPKPEKLNNKAKFTFIDTYEDNNDNIINANKWENEEIEINEEIDNFNEKNTSNEINTWNKELNIEEEIDEFKNFTKLDKNKVQTIKLASDTKKDINKPMLDDADDFWSLGGNDKKIPINQALKNKFSQPNEFKTNIKEINNKEITSSSNSKNISKSPENQAISFNSINSFFNSFASSLKASQNIEEVKQNKTDANDLNQNNSAFAITSEIPKDDDLDFEIKEGWGVDGPDQIPLDDIEIEDINIDHSNKDKIINENKAESFQPSIETQQQRIEQNELKLETKLSNSSNAIENPWGDEDLDINIDEGIDNDLNFEENKQELAQEIENDTEDENILKSQIEPEKHNQKSKEEDNDNKETQKEDTPEEDTTENKIFLDDNLDSNHDEKDIVNQEETEENTTSPKVEEHNNPASYQSENINVKIESLCEEQKEPDQKQIEQHDDIIVDKNMIQDRKESIEFEEIGWGNDIQAEIDDIDSQKFICEVTEEDFYQENKDNNEKCYNFEQKNNEFMPELHVEIQEENKQSKHDNIFELKQEDLNEVEFDINQDITPISEDVVEFTPKDREDDEASESSDSQSEVNKESRSHNNNQFDMEDPSTNKIAYEEYEPSQYSAVAQLQNTEDNQDIFNIKDEEQESCAIEDANNIIEKPELKQENKTEDALKAENDEIDIDEELKNLASWGECDIDEVQNIDTNQESTNQINDKNSLNIIQEKNIKHSEDEKDNDNNEKDDDNDEIIIEDAWNQPDLVIDEYDF